MSLYSSYCIEYNRVIPAIILEGRQTFAQTKGKSGAEVKAFFDSEVAKVVSGILPYIIESENGNLAAYFSLRVTSQSVIVYQLFIRPNFEGHTAEISDFISSFVQNQIFRKDILDGVAVT